MTLSLLRPYEGLTPLYIDLANADDDNPLVEVEDILNCLRSKHGSRPFGRPLLIIDALNELVDPFRLCERLAMRISELESLDAKLIFLFSFRHRSYPGEVRAALLAHKLGPTEEMELLFDPKSNTDLAFFPELLPAHSRTASTREELLSDLRTYSERCSPGALSREDLAAYLRWRASQAMPDPRRAPSPAQLRFKEVIGPGLIPDMALVRTCDVAFDLLSDEVTARRLAEVAVRLKTTETEVRRWIEESDIKGLVSCDGPHVRFKSETAVRVLSALSIARRLRMGQSPWELRGRTSYDVCAPFLQPAILWLAERDDDSTHSTLERIITAISEALRGRDGPYSFYAMALCSEWNSIFGARREELDACLFEQMIVAIDEDRCQTCRESLEGAGRSGRKLAPDPVLDQLFEVMSAYSRSAVALLLKAMVSSPALVKSQAAYLLLDWVGNVELPLSGHDQMALESIPTSLSATDGNLHFRFHEVEVLETLLTRFPDMRELNLASLAKLEEIAVGPADRATARGAKKVYDACQKLVILRAEVLLQAKSRKPLMSEMEELLGACMRKITSDPRFWDIGTGDDAEVRLECWEVVLGFAVWVCPRAHRTTEHTSFLEAALEHPFWIVRWWAFFGLLGAARTANPLGRRVLAERCIRRAMEQLCGSVEPMGLKLRQCALTKRMLQDEVEVSRATRQGLLDAFERHLSEATKHTFMDGYYESMGTSPDAYLAEFFRRIAEVVPSTTG